MKRERIIEILKSAYNWGISNGSNRSDKNFNDWLQTSEAIEILAFDQKEQSLPNQGFDEYARESIENALYATNHFLPDQCTELADGILGYLRDAGFKIVKCN